MIDRRKGHPEVEGTMGQVKDGIYLSSKTPPTSPICG